MGREVTLSILGLYNYDNSIFDNLVVPDEIDIDVLKNNILMECGELELIYTNFDMMKFAIGEWSKKRLQAWQKIADVMYEDYDPFINIKRDEERTVTETRNLEYGTDVTTKDNVNAWDDSSSDGTLRDTSNVDGTNTDKGTVTTHEIFHVEGDSAITDAQDVMRKEVEVRDKYNLYNYIINEFKNRFCLLVY